MPYPLFLIRMHGEVISGVYAETWVSLMLIFCLLCYTLAKFLYNKRFAQLFKAFFAYRFIKQLERDGTIFNERISIPLYLNFIITLSLVLFYGSVFLVKIPVNQFFNVHLFLLLLVGLVFFIFIKGRLIRLIGFVFETRDESNEYALHNIVFNHCLGLILIPCLILIVYNTGVVQTVLLSSSIALIMIIYGWKIVRVAMIGIRASKFSILYLFVYLCTLEILPALLMVKFVNGIVF